MTAPGPMPPHHGPTGGPAPAPPGYAPGYAPPAYAPPGYDSAGHTTPSRPPRVPGNPALGRWSLGFGITALVCGLLTGIGIVMQVIFLQAMALGPLARVPEITGTVGTLVGLTAIGLGIGAVVTHRGRRAGKFGIGTAVGGALLVGLAWAALVLFVMIGLGAIIIDQTT